MSMNFSVDVFVTAYNEEHALIEKCLQAACQMRGEHSTWLLDDGSNPDLLQLARRYGAGYLTRTDRKNAKAGNVNSALRQTCGEIIVIFDVDHVPQPDFLEQTLPFFANSRIGFVQVMLTFSNAHEGWVAQAAIESSRDFYSATSVGADAISGATLVGSNALIRREALESIGGYQPGLAEDLATSMALHAKGWDSIYVYKPLAPGLAPPDLAAWFAQQLKWSRGVFDLLLTSYPHYFFSLSLGQRVSYAVRLTYYWLGPIICLHLIATMLALYTRSESFFRGFEQHMLYLLPLAGAAWLIRISAFWQWRRPSEEGTSQWRAVLLVYATWPIYTLAWLMAMFRLPLAFRPTPKKVGSRLNPFWLAPQIISLVLLIGGILYAGERVTSNLFMLLCVLAQAIPHVWILAIWLFTANPPTTANDKPYVFRHSRVEKCPYPIPPDD